MEISKRAFTLLETLFVLLIIAIVSSIAIPKFSTPIKQSSIIKLKSDIYSIRAAILEYKSSMIKQNSQDLYPSQLDSAPLDEVNSTLFNEVLQYPYLSTDSQTKEKLKWSKSSESSYVFYLNSSESIEFVYNSDGGLFDCDYSLEICQEVSR
jgi:general secretion pathway protein G